MTARQLYEWVLIDLNKVESPSFLLGDFIYFFNKAINQYVNRKYNIYDINQQATDDLRALKATAILTPTKVNGQYEFSNLYESVYEVTLPVDYLHILNCVCEFSPQQETQNNSLNLLSGNLYVSPNLSSNSCAKDNVEHFSARRLTADTWSTVINNYYLKPTYRRPYFYLHNVNTVNTDVNSNNPYIQDTTNNTLGTGTDFFDNSFTITPGSPGIPSVDLRNFATRLNVTDSNGNTITENLVDKKMASRVSNPTSVRLEIRCGKDDPRHVLQKVFVDYVKSPQYIKLTKEQLDLVDDTSQILEFPDYVCYEIVNELVTLIMENVSDPRLQTHIPVIQSIAPPIQPGQTN